MQSADVDDQRLVDLFALDLIDGVRSETFDRVARIASLTFDVPVALVTMLDDDDQYFCGVHGTDMTGNRRAESFCNHTVRLDDVLVVPDATLDPRFRDLPVVTGPPYFRFYAGAPVSAPGGAHIGTLCILDVPPRDLDARQRGVLRDLADLVEIEIGHHGRALTDPLTQLANRRAFMAAADRFVALGRRRDEPVSLVFADLNGLKRVNDEFGHIVGDSLIQRAASCIDHATRRADLAARIGGDEFAVLLFGTDAAGASQAIATIQDRIVEDNRIDRARPPTDEITGSACELSIAFGSATVGPEETIDAFVSRADSAMYDAKRADAARHCNV